MNATLLALKATLTLDALKAALPYLEHALAAHEHPEVRTYYESLAKVIGQVRTAINAAEAPS